MDFLGIIAIIFIGIIVSAVSAASKKKQQDDGGEGGVPRRPAMSDIQRAFMMMSGLDNDENERKREQVLTGFKAPSPPSGAAAYNEGLSGAEGTGDREGKSDFGSVSSGSLRGDTPIEQAGFKSDYRTGQSGSLRGNTAIEAEAGVYKYAAASETVKEATESVIDNEASTLTDITADDMEHRLDESAEMADIAESSKIAATRRVKPALKLFENKNDFVKAVIFSEVLSRRQPAGRAALKR
jgi:hypothetical protein